jgi:bisphosphoglycerate-independent phosphoglycerate mutase (AlkP superfamily)
MNRRCALDASAGMTPQIIDLAPTILNYLDVPVPEAMEGTTLL